MSKEIHVGVQPLSRSEWVRLFEQNGLKVTWSNEAPMHMLEPRRVLRDEGGGQFANRVQYGNKSGTAPADSCYAATLP